MGGTICRVVWVPGADRLPGTWHCGGEHAAEDPVEPWQWLVGHPGHGASEPDGPAPLTALKASRPTTPPPPLTGLKA
jgi:hypothetical protein